MSEIKYKMLPLPSVFMMEADFPIEHVDTLNTFLDDLLLQEDRLTAADMDGIYEMISKEEEKDSDN